MYRNNVLFFRGYSTILIIILLSSSCSILPKRRCWQTGYIQHDSTWFPPAQLDFSPKGYQARLAVPTEDSLRIWVKGNSNYNYARVFTLENEPVSRYKELLPPYYTAVISLKRKNYGQLNIKFGPEVENLYISNNGLPINTSKLTVFNDSIFSFLVYGCFQPFKVNDSGAPLLLYDASNPLNYEMRQLFEDVGLEKPLSFYPDNIDTIKKEVMVKNIILAIGTGDQVYVDAGYEASDFRKHALTGWAHGCKDPYPLLDQFSYEEHMDRCYRNFYSFKCFDEVFAKMPIISVWDDHEIRDGWGSHGDEYDKKSGRINEYLQPYFRIAKSAYIAHQYAPGISGVNPAALVADNSSLEQAFEYNGIPVFAFDLRSHRDINRGQVLDEDQQHAFIEWCRSIKDSSEVIIVSSIPFFYKPFMPFKLLARIFQPGLRDDINDGWYSKYNEDQRNEIMQEIINLRDRGIKPIIISGDAHLGGMISAWYESPDGKRKRLCYELIYSGLSHESLGEERQGFKIRLRKRPEGQKKNDPTFTVGNYKVEYIYEFIQGRLNFGALQFEKGKNTTASLFIVGNDEKFLTELEMVLNWEETYEQYLERAVNIIDNTFSPPELYRNKIERKRP